MFSDGRISISKRLTKYILRIKENLFCGLCISVITLAELEHGVEKSQFPERNRSALLQFLAILEVLPFDDDAATEYGKICADLQRKGTPIGTMDMLIAGHARAEHVILVTNNTREFERVQGLRLENWAEE